MQSRVLVAAALLFTACSAPAGSSSSACADECESLASTCPGKVSNAACMTSCEQASEFVWAATGTAGNSCANFYMGERADVPCGAFASLPCIEEDQPTPDAGAARPDARPQTPGPDARPAPDAAQASPDAGGTVSRCPIEKGALKVAFPYASMSPPTVVELGGYCFKSTNGVVSEGYNSASAVNAIIDATGTVAIADVANAGILFEIGFVLDEAQLSPSQVTQLADKTGIPADKISVTSGRLVSTFDGKPATVGYTLPAGVTLSSFIPSSSLDKGFIKLSATSKDLAALQQVLLALGSGISVKVPVQKYISAVGAPTYEYRFRLSSSGTKVKIESITVVP